MSCFHLKMIKNYTYDGTLKSIAAEKKERDTDNDLNEFSKLLQNQGNALKDDPDARYNAGMALGDPESADLRIVGLGHSGSGNSSLMLRLMYNEWDDEDIEDNPLMQWEHHQTAYTHRSTKEETLRISYFDLKGFDDVLSHKEMEQRIGNSMNHSFNVIVFYYAVDDRTSFEDQNGFSVQSIKEIADSFLRLIDSNKFIVVLVGLKSDVDDRTVSKSEGMALAAKWGDIPFIEISSKTGDGIKSLMDILCSLYIEGAEVIDGDLNEAAAFNEDQSTLKSVVDEEDDVISSTPKMTNSADSELEQKENSMDSPSENIVVAEHQDIADDDAAPNVMDENTVNLPSNTMDDDVHCEEIKDEDNALEQSLEDELTESKDSESEPTTKPLTAHKPRPENNGLSKKTMSVTEFKSVPLKALVEGDDSLRDHFDIARKICLFFDGQFGDTDTVCVVAENGKMPAIAYWVKGDYVRKEQDVMGKEVMVYRACKHREAKQPKVSGSEFEKFVKKMSVEYEECSVDKICDLMDDRFGTGCHYARSTVRRPRYDIFSRFSHKYDAGFKLPSGSYIIAWRR